LLFFYEASHSFQRFFISGKRGGVAAADITFAALPKAEPGTTATFSFGEQFLGEFFRSHAGAFN